MIEIVDGHFAHQRNQHGKVQNTKLCLPNQTPVQDADWFKYFQQLYFKAGWTEIHFFLKQSLPIYTFVFTSAKNMSLLVYLAYTCEEALNSKVCWKYYHWGRKKY